MKVLLFGGKGYIAGKLLPAFPGALTPDIDIADQQAVSRALDELKPDIVINTAGKTGRPNVDWCEDHKIETIRSNLTGPLVLLEECLARDIYFVHIGSGCIYAGDNGGRGFTEEDEPNFTGSFYSLTKYLSEKALKSFPVLQLRLRMPFDGIPNPRNLITKINKYPKVLDAENSLTYLPDLVKVAKALIAKRATGIYNVTNSGPASPYRKKKKYKEIVDPSHTFERITIADLPSVAKAARSNCILSSNKLAREGIEMLSADEALREALTTMQSLL